MYRITFFQMFIIICFNIITASDIVTEEVRYSTNDIVLDKLNNGYDIVTFTDAVSCGNPGEPRIPSVPLQFLIPVNAEIEKVEIIDQKIVTLSGKYKITPVQEAVTFSLSSKRIFIEPIESIYSSSDLFPSAQIETSSTGIMSGFKIIGLKYYPIQYNPLQGKLQLTTSMQIRLHYKNSENHSGTSISERQFSEFEPVLKKMVRNPDDMKKCKPTTRDNKITDVNYAIITDQSLVNEFESFKQWKTKKGFKTEVFSTSWIYEKYSGYDNAEKIRNFLKEYHKDRGLIYALLAGDCDKIPERDLSISAPLMAFPHDGMLATDLYYSDLDGTWDSNNNHKYGESPLYERDLIDGMADIFVGRAPVDNINDVKTFIDKDTTAEKHPVASNQKRFLLFSGPVGGGHEHFQNINKTLQDTVVPGWYIANKDYKGEQDRNYVFDSLNKGFSLCHLAAHGEPGAFVASDKILFNLNDVEKLNNKDNLFVLFSMACNVGCYDHPSQDCIAEKLMNKPNGGCVATILNSREGLGDIDAKLMKIIMGYSERLCIEFNSNFFKRDEYITGKIHSATRNKFRDYAWGNNDTATNKHEKWAWAVAEWNLFGDPDLPMYKEIPLSITANYPKAISAKQQEFTVKVTDSNGPLANAYVCCYKNDEVFTTGKTNNDGQVVLSVKPASNGLMYVTATARDHTPFEGTCSIGDVSNKTNLAIVSGISTGLVYNTINGNSLIHFTLTERADIKIQIFSASGALLRKHLHRDLMNGSHEIAIGNLERGIYMIKFMAGNYQKTEKVIILK